MRFTLVAVAILVLSPLALGQEHAHDGDNGMAMIVHDGPRDGRAVVGGYTHFGFALIGSDGLPTPHQNAEFMVTQNGAVLFSTTDTHEYDGLFSFDIKFTKPGPYQVMAMSGDMQMGFYEGTAILPANATAAQIAFVATPTGPASSTVDVVLSITDASGAIVPHSDAIVEFRSASDNILRSRTHLHIHEDPITFTQALGPGTDIIAQVIAYDAFANGRSPDVPAIIATFPVNVGPVAIPSVPTPSATPPALLQQRGSSASADGYTLQATYDPANQVGLGQMARVAGVLIDEANASPVAHVDYRFTLTGPRGVVFSSASLHEYDGVFEYAFVPEMAGVFTGTLTAVFGEVELTVPVEMQVVPPVVAGLGGTGPISYRIDGVDGVVAGEATNLTFAADGPAGPAAHSEVDVTILQEGQVPIYQFKLHTHGSGLTNAMVVFPHAGEWLVIIDGLPTVPEPSVYPNARFAVSVAPGMAAAPAGTLDTSPAAAVPAAGALLMGLAVAAVALLARRRV